MKGPMGDQFEAAGLSARIGTERHYPTVRAAVDAYAHEQPRAAV
jgi:hypothetical protein